MKSRITYLFSLVLALGLASGVYGGQVVVGDFEGDLDGWFERDATLSLSTTGATTGTQALQVDGPGDWHINALLDLRPHRATLANPGVTILADVTAFDADLTTTWMNIEMVINAQNNDDTGANNNIGWQSLGSQAVVRDGQPQTLAWVLPETLTSAIAGVDDNISWFELALVTNLDAASVTKFYIDNIRFIYEDPTSSVVLGDFEDGLDGWFERDATLSLSATGATLGVQALQVDGPGNWHINTLLDLRPHRASLANSGAKITADVTAFDSDMTTTWMNVEMVVNAQNNDDSGTNNNIGWQSLGSLPVTRDGQPNTYTWELSEELTTAIAGADDNISWFELALVTNVDAASVTKFYIDNIQLLSPVVDTGKSTDVIIGNWEQDLDGWVVGGGADALFNDHNGVTLDNYSLDVYIPNGDWNQDVLTLNLIETGLLEIWRVNQELSVDVTRLVADWPIDDIPGWNGIHMIINAGGDGWSIWENMGYRAGWQQTTGDQTQAATWDYGQYLSQIDFDNLTWCELKVVSNANDPDYAGWVLFYLDNMRLTGAGVPLDPQPANGTRDVPIDSTVNWTPGTFAATHHLYFGLDSAKVRTADMDSDPDVVFMVLDETGFDPGELEFKTQYFWRVDEVNEANPDGPWPGQVWNFVTADFLVIDDFESYNDINPGEPGSMRIFDTWSDGFGVETNGALVGHDFPPHAEQTTFNNGAQSMPIYYDNVGAAVQSEAQRIWAEPQVWMTSVGTNTLKLYTHGAAANTPGELYVIIEDNTGVSYKVTNPDSTTFTAEEWMEMEISLNAAADAGVNLAAVTKLVIGIANIPGQAEASGILYVDDIRRHPPVVVSLDPDHVVVPKTSVAPIIDGQWDAIWNDVNETRCLISDIINTDSATPEDAADLSAVFKACYDDANFYMFVEVQDSVIDHEFSDWQGDGLEVYFDGDYSHGDSYDGVNDNQIRITVDDVVLSDTDSSVAIDGTVFKVLLTATGYNIEASFPLEVLQIYPSADPEPLVDADGVEIPNSGIAPNNIIGFEVQINDNDSDGSGRQTMLRWHSDNNDSWNNPGLFGQARLVTLVIGN